MANQITEFAKSLLLFRPPLQLPAVEPDAELVADLLNFAKHLLPSETVVELFKRRTKRAKQRTIGLQTFHGTPDVRTSCLSWIIVIKLLQSVPCSHSVRRTAAVLSTVRPERAASSLRARPARPLWLSLPRGPQGTTNTLYNRFLVFPSSAA